MEKMNIIQQEFEILQLLVLEKNGATEKWLRNKHKFNIFNNSIDLFADFTWEFTLEGYDYWRNLQDEINEEASHACYLVNDINTRIDKIVRKKIKFEQDQHQT